MKLSKTMDSGRTAVRSLARSVAKLLNSLSGGRLSPNSVTLFGFVMHIPIALLIARGYFIYGGIGLIIFGLFDTLDGELARLQERPSAWGMFLDSITDRMK
jgi:phosphatidylglycerophosphate synthase